MGCIPTGTSTVAQWSYESLKAVLALASLLMALVCSGYVVLQWWLFGTLVETEAALGLVFWKNLLELAAGASVFALLLSRRRRNGCLRRSID
jgi:hypothetical protein